MSEIDDLMDSLGFANVYAGQPVERREFAVGLNARGVTAKDVELLEAHCKLTVKAGPPAQLGVLVALLRDDRKRDDRLADLRDIAAKRAAQDRPFGDKPYVPGPVEGEPVETWDHDRQCRMAKCRHDGDRVPMANLARELGVSETTAELMVARGRVLDQSAIQRPKVDTPAKIEKAEAAGAKRVTDFRERMSIDRKQRERAGGRKPFDWDRMHREEGKILARLRSVGNVDLAEIMRDPVKRGALATLEADGHVLRADAPDEHQCQPYHVAKDDAERAEFIARRRRWEQDDMGRSRRKPAGDGREVVA